MLTILYTARLSKYITALSSRLIKNGLTEIQAKKRAMSILAGRMAALCAGCDGAVSHKEDGKPFLPDRPDLTVSITHCGDTAAVCCAPFAVGIDCERIDALRTSVLERAFCENERKYVLSSEDKNMAFFLLWTQKEALVKASGISLSQALKTELAKENGGMKKSVCAAGGEWQFAHLRTAKEIISVCFPAYVQTEIKMQTLPEEQIEKLLQTVLQSLNYE